MNENIYQFWRDGNLAKWELSKFLDEVGINQIGMAYSQYRPQMFIPLAPQTSEKG
jgi:hypothetical protein